MHALAAGRGLPQDVVNIGQSESTVMEPVIAHPAIDHRALRRGYLERRMRVQQGHHDRKTLITRPDHAHAPVRLRHILHQPIDRVVAVGGVVGTAWVVARVHRRRRHQVHTLRTVFAAHILVHADIPGFHKDLIAQRQRFHHASTLRTRRPASGVVRCARQQNGRALGPFGHHNYGVQLRAVAHGYHDHALVEIGLVNRRL